MEERMGPITSDARLDEQLFVFCQASGKSDDEIISALATTLIRVVLESAPIKLMAHAKIESVIAVMRETVSVALGHEPPSNQH
jgi:hypothetical protein